VRDPRTHPHTDLRIRPFNHSPIHSVHHPLSLLHSPTHPHVSLTHQGTNPLTHPPRPHRLLPLVRTSVRPHPPSYRLPARSHARPFARSPPAPPPRPPPSFKSCATSWATRSRRSSAGSAGSAGTFVGVTGVPFCPAVLASPMKNGGAPTKHLQRKRKARDSVCQ
jgi:hypothetical protein